MGELSNLVFALNKVCVLLLDNLNGIAMGKDCREYDAAALRRDLWRCLDILRGVSNKISAVRDIETYLRESLLEMPLFESL